MRCNMQHDDQFFQTFMIQESLVHIDILFVLKVAF